MRDLIAVVDAGSVRAAARRLGLSQAAISKNLTALERSLGVSLLVRTAHGVEPTDYGRVVLRRARIVDTELRKLKEEIDDLAGDHHGSVTVGLSSTAEAMLLPAVVLRFRQRHPDMLVSVVSGRSASTVAALREGRIDFAVGPPPPGENGADLRMERLMSSDLGFVTRAGHPLARCSELALLARQPWIIGVRHPQGRSVLETLFDDLGLGKPDIAAHCDSTSAMVSLLLATDLVTLTSLSALKDFCRDDMLAVLPISMKLPPVVQHLITSAQRPLAPAADALAAEFRRASRRFRR